MVYFILKIYLIQYNIFYLTIYLSYIFISIFTSTIGAILNSKETKKKNIFKIKNIIYNNITLNRHHIEFKKNI
jgi:hypothetical protein